MRTLFTWKFVRLLVTVILLIGGNTAFSAAEETQSSSLMVKFASGLAPAEQAAIISRNGGVEISSIPVLRLHVIQVPNSDLPRIRENYQLDSQVESVETNWVRKAEGTPDDPGYGVQWALSRIGWPSVYDTIVPPGSAKVALLDTGVDATHPDLSAVVIPGASLLNGSNGLTDPNGHGTWMAGIVAASTNNRAGVAGVAYGGVTIMPVTVLDAGGVGRDSDIIAGIVWAADHGADVILMAFSNPDFSLHLQDAIDYAWSKGVVLVAATGNSGITIPTFPAGDKGVIGVSGTDENDALAFGSNIGQSVFLAAPGSNMYTTSLEGGYVYVSGTSPASAVVAGVAAFMKAVDPALTNGVITGRLARSADAIGSAGDLNNRSLFGNGRINMVRALADTGNDTVQPAGAAPVGNGGPYAGPYTAAALHVSSINIGATGGSLIYGVPGNVTFPVTLVKNGNGNLPVTASGLPAGVTFTPTSISDNFTLTISSTATFPAPGSYDFTLKIDNVTSNTATLVITNKITITVTADAKSKTYGDTEPPLTYGITGGSLNAGDTFTGALTRAAGENAGIYAIQQGTLALPPKYNLVFAGANLTINKKTASVTPNAASKIYGTIDPALTGALSGFLVTDNVTATYSRTAGETAGSPYIISATLTPVGVLANYNIAYNSATFTIGKATATVNLSNMIQTYSGSAITPTATTTPAGLSVVWAGLPLANAGSYPVTATVNDTNYQGSADGFFTINKANAMVSVWPTASAIDAGQSLASSMLSGGTATPGGSFSWTTPAATPAVGTTLQSVTYAPADNANYTPATGMVSVTVNNVVVFHTITAAVNGSNGSITPAAGSIVSGDQVTLTITPADGYLPLALKDNGNDVTGSLTAAGNNVYRYTLNNVVADHTISVSFGAAMSITAGVSGSNGAITPTRAKAPAGGSSAVILIPSAGYVIDAIIDNGVPGLATDNGNGTFTYNLVNIAGDHDVQISFRADPNQNDQHPDSAQVPAASNVGITIGDEATFAFDSITTSGAVLLNHLSTLPGSFPAAYQPVTNRRYDVTVPAFAGKSTVCITYHPNDLADPAHENQLQLFHFSPSTSAWENLNAVVHTTAKKICGTTTSFSPLVIGEPSVGGGTNGTYTVTPFVAGSKGGTISPAVPQTVQAGTDVTFSFAPADGYQLAFVTVGAMTFSTSAATYRVNNVNTDLNVIATFIPITHTITVNAGSNGSVSPGTSSSIGWMANQKYTITPAAGYRVDTLTVDSVAQTPATSYTFNNVTADHTLSATFAANPLFTITASVAGSGTITPMGDTELLGGQSRSYTITPNAGQRVEKVLVDGVNKGAITSYTFSNVQADHTIQASFVSNSYTITATAYGKNGGTITNSIDNSSINSAGSGSTLVPAGMNSTYTFTPKPGFQISNVNIGAVGKGAISSYTFTNVQSNQTLGVTFVPITYTITAAAGSNGSISPKTSSYIGWGATQKYTITPAAGYHVETVTVDGVELAAPVTGYTFTNVLDNHSISATFAPN